MVGTKASAKKAWKTRKRRYGKDGRISTRSELVRTASKVASAKRSMKSLARRRKEVKGKARKKAVTRKVAVVRATTRSRPVRLGYYKGDQVRPLASTPAGLRQFARTVLLDKPRDGSRYETWEKRRKRGKDTVIKEWLHVGKKPKVKPRKARARRKLKKVA